METFLLQATIYLFAAMLAVPLAMRFGLGSVLGYLIAGIVIGPVLGIAGSETIDLRHFAEFGVVMMLFLIGLELEPRALWDMRNRLIGLGGLQIVATGALITAAAQYLGQPFSISLAIGLIFSLSSTAIVLQTLTEKRLMQTPGGKASFSVLLTQDISVIPMLALFPLLALPALPTIAPDGSLQVNLPEAKEAMSLVSGLPGWGVTLVTLAAVGFIILAGIFLMRPAFYYVHTSRLRELTTAFALMIVVGIAALMNLVGLSPALGTFLAGVVLANSEFRHELESDIAPFKGLLLGLFFITVGAGIDFNAFLHKPGTIVGLALGIMAIKFVVLAGLGFLFKLKGRDYWLFALGLAQAGEFGFVLISFSLQQNVLPEPMAETLLLVIALSMLLTPLFFILYEFLSRRVAEATAETPHDQFAEQEPIIIAGTGRFGQIVNRLVQLGGFKTTVLDHDLKTIQLMRQFGFKAFLGDPTRPDMLYAAGFATARVLVVAMDDRATVTKLVQYARRERPDIHIVARAHDRVHVFELYRAGANDIVRELFDSSLRAGRYVLENMGLSDFQAGELEHSFYTMDRKAMRELAELWDPTIPVHRNAAYMNHARALNRDFETALVATLDENGGTPDEVSEALGAGDGDGKDQPDPAPTQDR